MTVLIDSIPDVGIRAAELTWGDAESATQGQQQEHCLIELIDLAKIGLIVDCSQVEVGNPELIDMLMRVRKFAKENGKHMALFSVPRALKTRIGLCNLRLALPAVKNSAAAVQLVSKLSGAR